MKYADVKQYEMNKKSISSLALLSKRSLLYMTMAEQKKSVDFVGEHSQKWCVDAISLWANSVVRMCQMDFLKLRTFATCNSIRCVLISQESCSTESHIQCHNGSAKSKKSIQQMIFIASSASVHIFVFGQATTLKRKDSAFFFSSSASIDSTIRTTMRDAAAR